MILLIAASVLASVPSTRIAWNPSRWPRNRSATLLAMSGLTLIVIALVLARTVALAGVPLGILPDEGDRAGTAISIIRGGITGSMFTSGWFYISNVYFWLLSGVLHLFGIGYAQARTFSAIVSILNSLLVVWIVARHFGIRAGVFAGAIISFLGVSLQFARLVNEAAPTAFLWTISIALLLEAARRSRLWLWTVAGVAGGASIYFYPTGRLWAVLAGVYALYLFVRAQGGTRSEILAAGLSMALGAVVAAAPFLLNVSHAPGEFTLRFQQTSIFVHDNLFRLAYYDPHWNMAQLLWVQVTKCLSLFTNEGQGFGFYPSGRPLTWGALVVLTLIGLGWATVSWRDSRLFLFALWFWLGLSSAVVTVETPDVERIGSAIPVLAIFPALVLESLVRRAEGAFLRPRWETSRYRFTVVAVAVVALMAFQQGYFYFHDYSRVNAWAPWNALGQAVNAQGSDTLVTTLGHDQDMINWGWTRLLAPYVPRGAIKSPGSQLPLALPATTNLAFALGPDQVGYIPYLRALYPGGTLRRYYGGGTDPIVIVYRITQHQWMARQGALVDLPSGGSERVPTLGARPGHVLAGSSSLRWVANWHIPQTDDYGIRAGPGPARLEIDGSVVLTVPAGTVSRTVTVALVRGLHHVVYDGTLPAYGDATVQWQDAYPAPHLPIAWRAIAPESLMPSRNAPGGLEAETSFGSTPLPVQRGLDDVVATCCLGDEVNSGGKPFTTTWTGDLRAGRTGTYVMSLVAEGSLGLKIDGRWIVRNLQRAEFTAPALVRVPLEAGWHSVQLRFSVPTGAGGVEWRWQPPGGQMSLVPPTALHPPDGAGLSRALPASVLGPLGYQPTDLPLRVIV
jgi:4-amino-4-deoxy-L-arabinose transferase-like glycosyltransferase